MNKAINYLRSGEAHIILKDLPTTVRGFVYRDYEDGKHIVLNSRLTREQNRKTSIHEVDHILSGELDDEFYEEYT